MEDIIYKIEIGFIRLIMVFFLCFFGWYFTNDFLGYRKANFIVKSNNKTYYCTGLIEEYGDGYKVFKTVNGTELFVHNPTYVKKGDN